MGNTKRGKNEGSIRERKDGRFEVRVTSGIDFSTGRSKRISYYANTRAEATKILHSQNDITYYANMTTNGLLTDKYINLLESCKVDSIQITLDGTKDVYNHTKAYIDCDDAFDKILNNIFLLATHDIFVSIRMNVSKINIHDLKELCRQLINDSRWNKKISIYFSPLLDYENKVSDYFDESQYYLMFEDLYQTLFDLGYYSSPKQFQIKPKSISCYGHDLVTVAIGPDGEFYNCQHELGTPEKVIGDIYTGMHFSKSIVAEHSKPLASKCSKCKFLPVCQGGCFFADQIANCPLKCQSVKYEYKVRSKLLYNFITKSK